MLSCLGRLAGIVAPFAGEFYVSRHFGNKSNKSTGASYIADNSSGILWLGAGGIWLASFLMVFLPVEMRNRQMF